MSAWIVSKVHIDALVNAALAWELTVPERADETGRMLWGECLASVACCYPGDVDGERPGPIDFRDSDVVEYTFEPLPGQPDPLVVQKAANCYRYQSCEHPGWKGSDAQKFTAILAVRAEELVPQFNERFGSLAEDDMTYGDEDGKPSAWGVYNRDEFERAMRIRQARTRVRL